MSTDGEGQTSSPPLPVDSWSPFRLLPATQGLVVALWDCDLADADLGHARQHIRLLRRGEG